MSLVEGSSVVSMPRTAKSAAELLRCLENRQVERQKRGADIERFKREHPTAMVFLGCMDGRSMIWPLLQTLPGTVEFWPTVGGKFSPTWPPFVRRLETLIDEAYRANRPVLIGVTYHRASTENDRYGCAGHACNVEAQQQFVQVLGSALEKDFRGVYVVPFEIETDTDRVKVLKMNPRVNGMALADLTDLLEMNRAHCESVTREIAKLTDHHEYMLVRGEPELLEAFGFLNQALLLADPIVPDDTQTDAIKIAGRVLKCNLEAGRVEGTPLVVGLALSGYPDLAQARLQGALHLLRAHVPDLAIKGIAATMHAATWKIETWEEVG